MGGPKTTVDNPKLREKSENFTDYTHASQRSYKFTPSIIIKVTFFLFAAIKSGHVQNLPLQHHC